MKNRYGLLFVIFLEGVSICATPATITKSKEISKVGTKQLNVMVYFAGNNDLYDICVKQMQQMAVIGSLFHVNFITQLDVLNEHKVKRYYIAKNDIIELEEISEGPEAISGTPASLASFVQWGMEKFPARDLFLIISNHGDGIKDRNYWSHAKTKRGIAINNHANCYLTNQGLEEALRFISQRVLGGRKISLVLTDACFMSMVEICSQIKRSVKLFVGSQDTEPFLGYNYTDLFSVFTDSDGDHLNSERFARWAVDSYINEHKNSGKSITHAAINLESIEKVEDNLKQLALLCSECIDQKPEFFEAIYNIREHTNIKFRDLDYIDLHHFYNDLINIITPMLSEKSHRRREVVRLALEGKSLLGDCILANQTGPINPGAMGLSLYFPIHTIHQSYYPTIFNQKTGWSTFLKTYLYRLYHTLSRKAGA